MYKRIVVFGKGKSGNISYYEMPFNCKVIYYIDNEVKDEEINECNGKRVYNPHHVLKERDWDYIYVSSIQYLAEMSKQLEDMGFRYGDDFITPYDIKCRENDINLVYFHRMQRFPILNLIRKISNGRMICMLFGNCQIDMLSRLLLSTCSFRREYFIVSLPPIFTDICRDVVDYAIDTGLFKECNLFITQHINDDNRFFKGLSTNYLCGKLDKGTKVIRIPNFFMKGYFPDAYDLKPDVRVLTKYYGNTGRFSSGYKTIDKLFYDGFCVNDIIERIKDPYLYNKAELFTKIENELLDFSKREKNQKIDVMITDYLIKNYDKELLFYCFRHPTMSVYTELLKRLLNIMGLSDDYCVDENLNIYTQNYSMLLYPSVVAGLGLSNKYNYMLYYPTTSFEGTVTFEEYVDKYCRYLALINNEKTW